MIFSTSYIYNVFKIETVQHRFTKRIPRLHSHSYHMHLTLLGMDSLEARRLMVDLLYVYKIWFKYVDVDSEIFFCVIGTNNGMCPEIVYKLLPSLCKKTRNVAVWNALKINLCGIKTKGFTIF